MERVLLAQNLFIYMQLANVQRWMPLGMLVSWFHPKNILIERQSTNLDNISLNMRFSESRKFS